MSDHHDQETAIVERLTTKLGSLVKSVFTTTELSQIEDEEAQITPSVAVIYNGYNPVQRPGNPAYSKIQEVETSWLVVVIVRSANGTRRSAGAREDASPIKLACFQALIGWKSGVTDELPMTLSPAPGAAFTDAGFAYYPIAFTNRRTYRGTD